MKKFVLSASLIVLSISSAATAKSSAALKNVQELCALEEEETSESFNEIARVDIKTTESISDFFLNLVNIHLIEQQYTDKALSFEEVKALFGNQGDQGYNDLYITTFESRSTGNFYVEVKSYPGDNPYATIFNAQDGKILARNSDGSIALITKKGTVYCSDINGK